MKPKCLPMTPENVEAFVSGRKTGRLLGTQPVGVGLLVQTRGETNMKQPTLFPMPKPVSVRAQLERFKKQHRIVTHRATVLRREENQWTAMLLEPDQDPADWMAILAENCISLEDQGLLVYGYTERSTIRELCERNGIKCDL